MTDPRQQPLDNGPSPADRDPAEGARDGEGANPGTDLKGPPGHLGPAGDPAEGKDG